MTAFEAWTGAEVLWRFGASAEDIAAGLGRKGYSVTAEAITARAFDRDWKRSTWPKSPPVHCPNCGETVVTLP
jgi:hypothetical protein